MKENMTKKERLTAINPVTNPGSLKKDIGSIGCSTRRSHIAKRKIRIAANPVSMSVSFEVHPRFGASIIVNKNVPKAAIDRSDPTGSNFDCFPSFDSGTMIAQKRIQTNATGTLIQKTMDQSKVLTARDKI